MTPSQSLDGLLAGLPADWVIGHRDTARLAVGPTGAFVLVPGEGDLAAVADHAHELAQRTRAALARHLSWVPFVDAAVVTSDDRHGDAAAILVPLDLLLELLVQGPPVIDRPAIAVLNGLLVARSLDGWEVGTATADAKIDLCDPLLQRSAVARP
jgi:hypothetical protein